MSLFRKTGIATVDTIATNEIVLETFSFAWQIKNFSLFLDRNETIDSGTLLGGGTEHHSWNISLKLTGDVDNDAERKLSIFLYLNKHAQPKGSKVRLRLELKILDTKGNTWMCLGNRTGKSYELQVGDGYGWDDFCTISELKAMADKSLKNYTFNLHCQVWLEGEPKKLVSNRVSALRYPIPEADIKYDRRYRFGRLFDESLLTDVTIQIGDESLKAHKSILAVSSPVFEAMFKTDMEEKKTNRVEIVGYSVTVLKAMLEHIYKGKTDDLEEYSMELLEIAEKYDLVDLKTDCEIAVANSLTVSNAAQTLELAIRNNAESLRIETEEFVRRHILKVKETKEFKEMMRKRPGLLLDIILKG